MVKKSVIVLSILIFGVFVAKASNNNFLIDNESMEISITKSCEITLYRWDGNIQKKLSTLITAYEAMKFLQKNCKVNK